jgi:YjbE family integral membrane protein
MLELISSPDAWLGLGKIIWIDILLSGDNAVVIALASRALPAHQQKKAIIFGSVAAVVLRVLLTVFAMQLLQMPWLKVVGGVLLLYIGIQLLSDAHDESHEIKEASSLWAAIRTILLADAVMSLDNVLALAAAAESGPEAAKLPLLMFGLALSIPIVVFGSSLVLKLMTRFPIIITLGAMLLGWIAGEMLVTDTGLKPLLPAVQGLHYIAAVLGAILVLTIGRFLARRGKAEPAAP